MKTSHRLLENFRMQLPRTMLALAVLMSIFVAQAQTSSPTKKTPRTGKVGKAGKNGKSITDTSAIRSKPAAGSSEILEPGRDPSTMNGLIDSLRRFSADSSRRANARRPVDSPRRLVDSTQALRMADSTRHAADSARHVADSVRRIVDSVHRVDSTAAAQRTWHLALGQGRNPSSSYMARIRERVALELRRTGRVRVHACTDTSTSQDGIWSNARASGAGKLLVLSIDSDSTGRSSTTARLFDIARSVQIDSSQGDAPDTGLSGGRSLAHRLVRALLPSSLDSACRIDSMLLATAAWSVSVWPSEMRDTLSARAVGDSLASALSRTPWASFKPMPIPDSCRSPVCQDSLLKSSGATFVLRTRLSRQTDSAWILHGTRIRIADGVVVDSVLVTDIGIARLSARLLPQILTPPASCRIQCLPAPSRDVWTTIVSTDSAARKHAPRLESMLVTAFRSRSDRQYLSLPSDPDQVRFDSVARSTGATRRANVRLSGSDTLWTMSAEVRDLRSGRTDTLALKRSGPRARIFAWFSRHLAASGERDEICLSPCRSDSARRESLSWAIMPDSVNRQVRTVLAQAFRERGHGRLDSLPDSLRCADLSCIDSLAAARSIGKTVWPTFTRGRDSSWTLSAKVADMDSDDWTDSVIIRDTSSFRIALTRSAKRFWEYAVPLRVCDSCISTDTLEAALAIALPTPGNGVADSLRSGFRDTLARIFAKESQYQILDTAKFPGLIGDSASIRSLRCKTGAAFLLRSEIALEKTGWHVKATLVEIATDRLVASLDYQDKSCRADRPVELAPWVARRLLGTETRTVAPSHPLNLPWKKICKIGIPALVGITSVLLHL